MSDLADDDELLRRIIAAQQVAWHADQQRWVPTLAGVRFDPDGMSTFCDRMLTERGDGPVSVATGGGRKSEELAYGVRVEDAGSLGFETEYTPDELTPIGYAHSSVIRPDGLNTGDFKALRTDLAERMQLRHGELPEHGPDGA